METAPELPNHTLHTKIGLAHGGIANVWAGRGRDCADRATALALRLCPLDDVDLEQLLAEIRTLRTLRHSKLLTLDTAFLHNDRLVLVSQLQDYGSVTDVIQAGFLFGLPEAAAGLIVHDVLDALAYLHSVGVVHRGVRGSHVLLSSAGGGGARLSGFRQATDLLRSGDRLRRLHDFGPHLRPSLLWLAPEVVAQNVGGYSEQSDVYSLGVTAVEMGNGFPPFADMDGMQMLMEKLRGTTPRLLDASTVDAVTAEPEHRDRRFSNDFHAFVEDALATLPHRRGVHELRDHPFLKHVSKSKAGLNRLLQPLLTPLSLPDK